MWGGDGSWLAQSGRPVPALPVMDTELHEQGHARARLWEAGSRAPSQAGHRSPTRLLSAAAGRCRTFSCGSMARRG